MMYLMRMSRWLLAGVLFSSVVFLGSNAMAWQVAEFGESGFLNVEYQVQVREAYRKAVDPPTDLYLRRNRLSFLGMANDTFGAVVQFEYTGDRRINDFSAATTEGEISFTLLDAYLVVTPWDALQFRAGKTKHILTRENQEGCYDHVTLDRSIFIYGPFSSFLYPNNLTKSNVKASRDNGVVALGNLFSEVFQYRLAVMQGNNYNWSNAPVDVGYRYSGRVHLSLLDPESGWGYRGSYLGKKKVLTIGGGYEFEPSAVYSSGTTGSEDYTAYTVDAFYEHPTPIGTFTLAGAYLNADFQGAGSRGVADATGLNGEKKGGYGKAAYMLGKTQVYGRYEKWNFARLAILDEDVTYTSGGVNYYIDGQKLKLTLDFSRIDKFRAVNAPIGIETITAQVQARF